MRIYRVHYYTPSDCSCGYKYYSSKGEAKSAYDTFRSYYGDKETEGTEIEVFDYPVTKEGMFRALNRLASHPDNG